MNTRGAKGKIAALVAMGVALGALGPVVLAQTAVNLTAPPNNALYALPATLALKAAATATAPASVTRVEFYANGSLIGTDTTRAFSFAWTNPAPGNYSITAIAYDSVGGQAASAARTVTVAPGNQPPTVNLTSPPNNSAFAMPATVTLKASAAAPETNDAVAKVDFFANGTLIGTDTSKAFSLTWTPSEGTYTLTAVATDGQGAQTTSAARMITVAANQAPTVRLTAPANNAKFAPPATIELKAAATAPEDNDTVTRVDFFANGVLIGTDTTKAYAFTWTDPVPGSYMLTAVATDGQGAQTTSAARTVTVEAANLPPTVHLTSPANGAVLTAPAAIELKASASAPEANDSVVRVDFFDGATLVGTATAAPFAATIVSASAGTHVLTAVATDAQGAQTVSAARSVTVNAAATAQIYYIVADHLNTPRMIQDQNAKVVWRWDQGEPFGDASPDGDPDGDGVVVDLPLRFPGQYFDREANLAYNVSRDYDPTIGRYAESDLVGLGGGSNTYLYANGKPLGITDRMGFMGRAPGTFVPGRTIPSSPTLPSPLPQSLSCDGKWRYYTQQIEYAPWIPGNCVCFWLCESCDSPMIWSGDKNDLARTRGSAFVDFNSISNPGGMGRQGGPTESDPPKPGDPGLGRVRPGGIGNAGDLGKGNRCICPKPGPEKGCDAC